MPVTRRKAFAYITSGERILLVRHPDHPEAGIQVPAGTVAPGEEPEQAALREAQEETGLAGLESAGLLGERVRDMRDFGRDEIHHRFFYHLRYRGDTPERWIWYEDDPADGSAGRIRLELFWAWLPDGLPELIADHDALLGELWGRLSRGDLS